MKKNRLKRFISIINIISCIVIFGMSTMTLVSPGFFAYEGSRSGSEKDTIVSEVESRSFLKSEKVYREKLRLDAIEEKLDEKAKEKS